MAQTKTAAKQKTTKKTPAKKAASKKSTTKSSAASKPTKRAKKAKAAKSEEEVTIDRRRTAERRDETAEAKPKAKLERREKVSRRRQIDPTTCERDYSDGEVEFMNALDAYKRRSGRMFPTCSEVLEVIREIGYVQLTPHELADLKAARGETDPEPTLEDEAAAEAEEALAESDELHVD